jgi:hypothetical protein
VKSVYLGVINHPNEQAFALNVSKDNTLTNIKPYSVQNVLLAHIPKRKALTVLVDVWNVQWGRWKSMDFASDVQNVFMAIFPSRLLVKRVLTISCLLRTL